MSFSRPKLTSNSALNVVGGIVIIYLLITLLRTVQHNYVLGKQIDDLNAQTALLQDQKSQLAYNIQYYNTDSFRDREARSKLGLQLPGENVVIIPRPSPTPSAAVTQATKSAVKRSNLQQWFDFLGGRRSS